VTPPKKTQKEIQTWSIEEVNQFLHYTREEPLHIGYILAIYTGMRKGEILGLRWKDCDFEQGKIHVWQNLVYTKEKGLFIQETKTKSSKRVITISEDVVTALQKHKRLQAKDKLLLGPAYQDTDLIVCTKKGTRMSPRNFLRHFHNWTKKRGLPKIRIHDLRHSHATIMLQLGEHPKVVSERLGHGQTSVTMDIYSHVIPTLQEQAAKNFSMALQKNS
jgi:integrase